MFNVNYYLTRLLLSPIFSILFGSTLFVMLKYFEPAYFCDGLTLDQLRDNLANEIVSYNEDMEKLENLNDKVRLAYQNKDYYNAFYSEYIAEWKIDDICEIFYKIRDLEEDIKTLDSNLKSSIEEPRFL